MAKTKSNRLEKVNVDIAKFMGYTKVRVGYYGLDSTSWQVKNEAWCDKVGITNTGHYGVNVAANKWEHWHEFNYTSSWDKLQPAYHKIWAASRKHKFDTDDNIRSTHAFRSYYHSAIDENNVEKAAEAVVEFIEWFNEISK